MPTLAQALQLGTDRLTAPPAAPHPSLAPAWSTLDWTGAREAALLDAAALAGLARMAGAPAGAMRPAAPPAPEETQSPAASRAVDLLPRLLADEGRALLPEWLELCAARDWLVPPLWLPRLLSRVTDAAERTTLLRVIGERGRWLAPQNPAWAWVHAAAPAPDLAWWDEGGEDERLGCLRAVRATDPAQGRALVAKTWADDPPEFRVRALQVLRTGLSPADEAFLVTALGDRRKDVRQTAQSFLALLPESALARRVRERAAPLLTLQRGLLLGRKLEVNLPASFDPAWKADGFEEKPPAGLGEKAFWAQQMLALLPPQHWAEKFELSVPALIELARKSSDWADLLLGAWYRAALLHTDAAAAEALLPLVLDQPKFLPAGITPPVAVRALLATCPDTDRWRLAAAAPALAWPALDLLSAKPTPAQARALLQHLAPGLRDGFNPGGSPTAIAAARLLPPTLRDEAARLLARDNGLSKPADAFMQALDLRAAVHAAFSNTPTSS